MFSKIADFFCRPAMVDLEGAMAGIKVSQGKFVICPYPPGSKRELYWTKGFDRAILPIDGFSRRITGWDDAQRQRCKCCGLPDKFNFDVCDKKWAAIVPPHLQSHVVCLSCFDDLAARAGVDYSGCILDFVFAGDATAFQFEITSGRSQRGPCRDTHCTTRRLSASSAFPRNSSSASAGSSGTSAKCPSP